MQVDLSELNRILKPDAKVIISLKYGTLVGLKGKPVGGDLSVYQHCVGSNGLSATLEEFPEESAPKQEAAPKAIEKGKDDDSVPLQFNLETW